MGVLEMKVCTYKAELHHVDGIQSSNLFHVKILEFLSSCRRDTKNNDVPNGAILINGLYMIS